jgi:phosphopantetheine adenylyltransferase
MDFRVAFPASFDPIHRGHIDNIRKAITTFRLSTGNRLIVGIAYGSRKTRFIDTPLAREFIKFGLP